MSKAPRGLSPGEAALWARLAQTVRPMNPVVAEKMAASKADGVGAAARIAPVKLSPPPRAIRALSLPKAEDRKVIPHTLDSSWDRKLAKAAIQPDFTLDLHGHTLASAHTRLDHGLTLAMAQGARLVLLITGRPRPSDDHAGRSDRRGAIRAKYLDWLASGPHANKIAAVRPAHPKHGGAGAVYIVLKRVK